MAAVARVTLDWSAPHHHGEKELPCRVCGTATKQRDWTGMPCEKACAEGEIEAEMIGAAQTTYTGLYSGQVLTTRRPWGGDR